MSTPVLNLPHSPPSTPPLPAQPPAANSLDTPSHQRLASYVQYSSNSGPYQQAAYVQAASELENKFISTSAARFVDFYFRTDPDTGSPPQVDYAALSLASRYKNEIKMYDPLIAALKPAVAQNWSFVNTSAHLDPDSKFLLNTPVKPDIALYGSTPPSNDNVCRSCDAELFIEVKTDPADDPFEDTDNGVVPRSSARGRDTRGQVITYLNAIQASQLRTHSFGALIIADRCRLFRLTRSAMEVTELFDYTTSPLLVQFLWRLSHAPPDVRGLDTTFEKVTAGGQRDSRRARELIDAVGKPLWSVTMGDHSFYVSHPFTRSHHLPVGRGTRCFVAVETKTDRICLLKDTWQVVGYHREGEVYARLKEQQVQNIPNVIVAKDVDGLHHHCGVDDYPLLWSKFKAQAIRDHQHYRLVLDVVGRPLVEFKSTHELVKCMLDTLQAHSDAWTKTRVEHRDISVGNIILVVDNGMTRGLLIDWELSRYESDGGARAYERTPQARELADDLESFLLVLLWVAISYAPSTMTAKARADELQVFDDANPAAKRRLISSGKSSVAYFNLSSPHFEQLLGQLLDGFEARYRVRLRLDPGPPISTVHLESHGWMLEILRQALEDETWRALKDAGEAQPVKRPEVTGLKRKSEIPEYGEMLEARREQAGTEYRKSQEDDVFT
ncbi:hypothetical protein FB45DRAFT_739927 [Roridomyces roridus]|uniref:Fungal-type protein kinase domain-containing protein n=1 Tax=Roridomyces roridus TaxID=1738132 RepID=A0AAD7FUY7_9AGAR|nr:hypothetical protein FB45DRAFT_739927 [Roridomyces roridus]